MSTRKPLGEILIEAGVINTEMITYALSVQRVSKERMGDVLLRLRFATDVEIARTLATQSGTRYESLEAFTPDREALAQIPSNFAQKFGVLPLGIEGDHLLLATDDPYQTDIADRASRFTNRRLKMVLAPALRLRRTIQRAYYMAEHPIDEDVARLAGELQAGREVNTEALLDLLLAAAVDERASDVHFSPTVSASLVSMRLDGVLHLRFALPAGLHARLVSTCKVRAGLDIADTSRPQDGRATFKFIDGNYDLRVSTMPTADGENLVIRVLSGSAELVSLAGIGLSDEQTRTLDRAVNQPHGTLFICGPTGSGKSTTLYAMLRRVNAMQRNIMTIEDPVEYRMPLAHQVEVNERAGLTFASSIRGFLRQDPDVILVGEVRDEETAALSMRAAQTGHMVMTSLHANDTVGALVRLRDLGVENYLIASTVSAIVAQRLLRKLCKHCREPLPMDFVDTLPTEDHPSGGYTRYRATGCARCRHTGYAGRQAVAEVLEIDRELSRMIDRGETPSTLYEAVEKRGISSMRDEATRLVNEGVTDQAEFDRVLGAA
jgi:type IV pilus assembly protein PilB